MFIFEFNNNNIINKNDYYNNINKTIHLIKPNEKKRRGRPVELVV